MRLPSMPLSVAITIGVFALIMATAPGHLFSVDGLAYYRTATTLVWDHSLLLDPPFVWDWVTPAPVWPVGLSLVQLPAAVIVAPIRSLQPLFDPSVPQNFDLIYRDPIYALMSWVNPLIVGLTAAVTYQLGQLVGLGRLAALLAGLAATLFSPLFFYGRADFAHPLSALLLVLGMLVLFRCRSRAHRLELTALVPIGAMAVLTRPVDGVLTAAVWLVIACWPSRPTLPLPPRMQMATAVLLSMIVGFAVSLSVNMVRRGAWLDFGYFGVSASDPDPLATTLAYLVSPGRGLPWHFPLVLLIPFGILALWRLGRRLECLALIFPIVLWTGVYAFWISLGDNSYGPRFLLPAIAPLAILAAASLKFGTRSARIAFTALATLGLAFNLTLLATDQLGYWGIRGANHAGTSGFWRQFELGAFAPIGSLERFRLADIARSVDVFWLRLWSEAGPISVVIMLLLGGAGTLLLIYAWRRISTAPDSQTIDVLQPRAD